MKMLYPLYFISLLSNDLNNQFAQLNHVKKNEMIVSWSYKGDRILFEITAPTQGWLAIGFNDKPVLTGTYLLMGRITDLGVELVEHYTISPGNYKPIESIGGDVLVSEISGKEILGKSTIRFSIPIAKRDRFRKDLSKNSSYNLVMAFSREDDFQHHSIMRTSVEIVL